ncbi:hypothetical protein SNEBB_008935 [Seison nebaliae]|nr:hypothetical protein SNEBB_008935 [Seison nebaliae]
MRRGGGMNNLNRQSMILSSEQMVDLAEMLETQNLEMNEQGYIELGQFKEALKGVGYDLPKYQLQDLFRQLNMNETSLTLNEFYHTFKHLREKSDFRGSLTSNAVLEKHTNRRKKDPEDEETEEEGEEESNSYHTVEHRERIAFATWMNNNLRDDPHLSLNTHPIDVNSTDDLYKKCTNGILLCKLINLAVPSTIDVRTINTSKKSNELNVYEKHENIQLALNSAESIGCNVINMRPDEIEKARPHLTLGLIWQIIRISLFNEINLKQVPGLTMLLNEDEDANLLRQLSPEQLLLRWANFQLKKSDYDGAPLTNFTSCIKDSEAYTYLIHTIAPTGSGVNLSPLNIKNNDMNRAEHMLGEANKIDCRVFVSPDDVVNGRAKLNLAFVANLFNNYPNLDVDKSVENEDEEQPEEETREERMYKNWINSMGIQPSVNYLYTDLNDCLVIFQLYDLIRSNTVNWKKVVIKFQQMRKTFQKIGNCNYAVDIGKNVMKFSLVGIGGEDIYNGNKTLTLALLWQLMKAYTLSLLEKLNNSDYSTAIVDEDILNWVNHTLTNNGKKSHIESFKDPKIKTGLPVIDLIDSIRPNSIDYNEVTMGKTLEERMQNASYAISASRKIGARCYALPEDIMEGAQKQVLTVFATLMLRHMQNVEIINSFLRRFQLKFQNPFFIFKQSVRNFTIR